MPRPVSIVNVETWVPEGPTRGLGVRVVDGRIHSVREERSIARPHDKVMDGEGASLLPGFIDSHTHLLHQGLLKKRIDLMGTRTLKEALGKVRSRLAGASRTRPLLAERWDESLWRERRFPTREELDALSRRVPIVLRRIDGHIAVANGAASRLIKGRLRGVDEATGILLEEASLNLNQVFPAPPLDSVEALGIAQRQALRLGVTTVHDFVTPGYLETYVRMRKADRLRIRAHVSLYSESLPWLERKGPIVAHGDAMLRLHGVKAFVDGSIGGHTAAFYEPYRDRATRGRLNHPRVRLRSIVRQAHRRGLRVALHAIGDQAADEAAFALVADPEPLDRIEHYETPTAPSREKMRRHGWVASMQPNFVGAWSQKNGMYVERLGATRVQRMNPFRSLVREGVLVAFGSDCMPMDPWLGLAGTVYARMPSQRLDIRSAVRAYTERAADALGRPDVGRIVPGAFADLVMAQWDWRNRTKLPTPNVRATWVGGRISYRADTSRPRRGGASGSKTRGGRPSRI